MTDFTPPEVNTTSNYTTGEDWNITTTTAGGVSPSPSVTPVPVDLVPHVVGAIFGGIAIGIVATLVALFVFLRVRNYRLVRGRGQGGTAELDVLLTRHNRKAGGRGEEGGEAGTPQERRYEANPDTLPRHPAPSPPSPRRSKTGTLGHHYSEPTSGSDSYYLHPLHEPRHSEYLVPVSPGATPSSPQGVPSSPPGKGKGGSQPPVRPPKPRGVTPPASTSIYQNVDTVLHGSSPPHAHSRGGEEEEEDEDHVYEPVNAPPV